MIINGFGGNWNYNGEGEQNWNTCCTFSLSGSYTGTLYGGSGGDDDKYDGYRLGSSSGFILPNALAFRFVINANTKFTSGTLSRYSSDHGGAVWFTVRITRSSYEAGYVHEKSVTFDTTNCPEAYFTKTYTVSSSVTTATNLTSLESTATYAYYNQEYVYELCYIPNVLKGSFTKGNERYSSLTRVWTSGVVSGGYTPGMTAYITGKIGTGYHYGITTNPAATIAGSLQYLPA